MCCVLSGPFATAGSSCYAHTVLVSWDYINYTLEHRIAVKLPNTIEGLVAVLCTLFLLQICRTDGTVNTTLASGIVPTSVAPILYQVSVYWLFSQKYWYRLSAILQNVYC